MAKTLSIKPGERVRYERTRYNWAGNPIETIDEVVTVIDRPRDEIGCFCRASAYGARVKVRFPDGDEDYVDCDYLSVYNTMADLTHEDYVKLRGEICHGSIYLSDYRNSFGVDENDVYAASEGFGMATGWNDDEDTPENFADYCDGVEWAVAA